MIKTILEDNELSKRESNIEVSQSEVEKQNKIIGELRLYYDKISKEIGRQLKMCINTLGCQMNAHDSEKLTGMMEAMGFERVTEDTQADIIIYNTCCIRENAEQKVYGRLGALKHLKEQNPYTKIIMCGCMMQQEQVIETIRRKYKHVDVIFGTFNLYKLPELLQTNIASGNMIIDIWKELKDIVEEIPCVREHSFKASVNIMYGCNNFCTYCIVPYVRGRERSREMADILNEIKALAADGVKEIVLLGQNVNSYGKNLDNPVTFAKLLEEVNKIEGIERIRFMTSHPKDLSDELIDAMKNCDKVCNHIHLPIQSGSTNMLGKMNRKYTKEQYLTLVDKIKAAVPDIAITTDIIVGFPGETDQDIEDTIDVVNKVQFNSAFTFIYSKRTGTPAASMENGATEEVIQQRFNKVLAVVNENIYTKTRQQVGSVLKVLVEDQSKSDSEVLAGRAENNTLVHFKGNHTLIGQTVMVKIVDCKTFYLIGELI